MLSVENIIVGAGPYGLSIAAHFRAFGIEALVIGQPMASWRNNMPLGMYLKSEPFGSNLSDPRRQFTLESFCRSRGIPYYPTGRPLSLDSFLAYAQWFQHQTGVDVVDATLTRLRWRDGHFELSLADEQVIRARRVILATGYLPFRRMPSLLGGFAADLVTHSAQHRDLARFAGKDVTIVGCGQSGLETAALLHEQGANVRLLTRAKPIAWDSDPNISRSVLHRLYYPDAGLGRGWRSLAISELPNLFRRLPLQTRHDYVARSWGPSGAWWLKERVLDRVSLLKSHVITRADERQGRLVLTVENDGTTRRIETDHVIAATGYQVDLERMSFLDPALRAKVKTYAGVPILNRQLQSSLPGLHFVGMASAQSFGPVMRFVHGTKHAARILSGSLRKRAAIRPFDHAGRLMPSGFESLPSQGGRPTARTQA
jgi:thioredoxin reductase